MEHTTTVSEQIYNALQRQAIRRRKPVDALVESWLKQHPDEIDQILAEGEAEAVKARLHHSLLV